MNNGFIKLDRKILEWEWYKDGNTARVFIHFLLKANIKTGRFMGEEIKRGELVISRQKLVKELNISAQSIRTAINHLKSTNEITSRSTPRFTIITIKNYEKYQQVTNHLTTNQPATNQQSTSNQPQYKKNKKNKNIKKDKNIPPPRVRAREAEEVKKQFDDICVSFPLGVVSEIEKVLPEKPLDYKQLFEKAEHSDFLSGRNGKANRRFTADWIIRNADKVLSGLYDNKTTTNNQPSHNYEFGGGSSNSNPQWGTGGRSYDLEELMVIK